MCLLNPLLLSVIFIDHTPEYFLYFSNLPSQKNIIRKSAARQKPPTRLNTAVACFRELLLPLIHHYLMVLYAHLSILMFVGFFFLPILLFELMFTCLSISTSPHLEKRKKSEDGIINQSSDLCILVIEDETNVSTLNNESISCL